MQRLSSSQLMNVVIALVGVILVVAFVVDTRLMLVAAVPMGGAWIVLARRSRRLHAQDREAALVATRDGPPRDRP